MPIYKRKGQLSLEFVLLIFGVILAGAIITLELAEKNPKFLGNESLNIKKETLGLFSSGNTGSNELSITETFEVNNGSPSSNESSSETNNKTSTQNQSQNLLPDLVPISLTVFDENHTIIAHKCHCWRHSENQFNYCHRGKCRNKCKNNTHLYITVNIKNNGTANVTSQFVVALLDNNEPIEINEPYSIGDNEWQVTFDYAINTKIKCCKCMNKINPNGKGCHKRNNGPIYNHTLTVVVDYGNKVKESNENNNNISVNITLYKDIIYQCSISLTSYINPNQAIQNNMLTIYDVNNHTYNLYIRGNNNEKGLIDEDKHIINISPGNSFSGNATEIIFRERGNTLNIEINGEEYSIPNNLKKLKIIANDPDNYPISYTINHIWKGNNFEISLNCENATVYIS